MAFTIAILLSVSFINLILSVAGAGIDYRGKAARTLPAETAYVPLVAQPGPKVTPTSRLQHAQLQNRQLANSICGFYQDLGLWETISCSYGVACVADRAQFPVYFYCSPVDSFPITIVYDYGDWPLGGCINGDGALCCGSTRPYWYEYEFDDYATVLCGCATFTEHFTISATTSVPVSTTFRIFTTLSSSSTTITTSPTTESPISTTTTASPPSSTTTTTPPSSSSPTTSTSPTTTFTPPSSTIPFSSPNPSSTTTSTSSSSSPASFQVQAREATPPQAQDQAAVVSTRAIKSHQASASPALSFR